MLPILVLATASPIANVWNSNSGNYCSSAVASRGSAAEVPALHRAACHASDAALTPWFFSRTYAHAASEFTATEA